MSGSQVIHHKVSRTEIIHEYKHKIETHYGDCPEVRKPLILTNKKKKIML